MVRIGKSTNRESLRLTRRRASYPRGQSMRHRHLDSLHAAVRDQPGALCRAYTSVNLPGSTEQEARRFISALGFK